MAYIHFFENDGRCTWVVKELKTNVPKYLFDPVEYEGRMVRFYLILEWISNDTRGMNLQSLDEVGVNYVKSVAELPGGAGIYVTGYDADVVELEECKKRGIPVMEKPCPWVRGLRDQLMEKDSETYQFVILIDKDHMVYDCYHTLFPRDAIIVQDDTYQECIREKKNEKPVILFSYATYRKKDADRVAAFIRENYPHKDNRFDLYPRTLCNWTKQGILEELEEDIRNKKLEEVWVICSSEGDRSTISVMKEIIENGAKPVIIKEEKDIPGTVDKNARIGVVVAPIPLSSRIEKIKDHIIARFVNT